MKKRPLPYWMYRSMWAALDVILPPSCGGCGKLGARWCDDCQKKVTVLLASVCCEVCGLPQESAGICKTCRADAPHFRALRAWTVFDGPIRSALHHLKYKRDISMGDALAAHMLPFVEDLNWQIDMLIPIPLGRQRLKERGYNQVGMIAKPIAMALNIRYAPTHLARRRETRTQVGLTKPERKENIRDAFQSKSGVSGKHILLFDDVATTGATLSSAAETLRSAGAKEVYALTVARALPQHGLRHA